MKLLAEISEGTLGIDDGRFEQLHTTYELRKNARGIILNDAGELATQYLAKSGYHKLPGGGVEQGEEIEDALKREVLEEVGCDCTIMAPVGLTIEYRNFEKLLLISYCFAARVVGEVGEATPELGEQEEGLTTLWLTPEEALARMKADTAEEKKGPFILAREIAFLEAYLAM